RKARLAPNFQRRILFGSAPIIAGHSGQCTCIRNLHLRQNPCPPRDPYSRWSRCLPPDPKSIAAAPMPPERNVNIRHVSRENIRRDPPRLIFAEQQLGRADCPHLSKFPKKYTHFAQNGHKQIKRLETWENKERWCRCSGSRSL